MLSKTKVKYIRSLELKKFRNENNVFVAEGNKLVADMLPAFECELLIAKPSWMATQGDIPAKELLVAEEDDIRKASFLKNPQDVLAIFKRPNWDITEITPEKELVLALDGIQDPKPPFQPQVADSRSVFFILSPPCGTATSVFCIPTAR